MTKFIALFYTMLAMLLIAVVSYSMQKSEEKSIPSYTIGVVLKAMDSEHWLSVRSGMTEAAQQKNMRLIVITAENETAFDEQNKIIDDLLNNGIDALIVSPTNINHTKGFVDAAQSKNIPVFSIDEEIDGISYIGSNNYAIGEMAAEFMSKNLPKGAEVSVISGSANQNAHIQRTKGFSDYINNETSLRIGKKMAAETQYRQAMTQAEKLLSERPNTRGIFVTSAIMTLGVIEATENLMIVGVDTQNDALMAVKNGKINALISQDGHESGKLAIEIVAAHLNGQPPEKYNFISNELITAENPSKKLANDADLDINFKQATVLMIIPKNWRQREEILTETERENFLSAFEEMAINSCRNSTKTLIFVSNRDGFFHWGMIAEKFNQESAERLKNFAKLYFNLELTNNAL